MALSLVLGLGRGELAQMRGCMSQLLRNLGGLMNAKKYLLASAVCFAPLAAHAASPVYNWTGFYVGASAGVVSQGSSADAFFTGPTPAGTFGISGLGFIGGGNIGYNWQLAPNWVIGLEADLSGTSLNDSANFTCCGATFSSRLDALGTVRARFGYAIDRTLIYATGGWAYGHVKNVADAPIDPFTASTDTWQSGWTAGGGVEYMILPNWTVRAEGLYVDLGSTTAHVLFSGNDCRFGFKNRYAIGRLGVNYKF